MPSQQEAVPAVWPGAGAGNADGKRLRNACTASGGAGRSRATSGGAEGAREAGLPLRCALSLRGASWQLAVGGGEVRELAPASSESHGERVGPVSTAGQP